MRKLVSILLAAALCAVLCVPALAETPMDASAVLFGNGFPIVANTSNEELDEKAAEDIASDDEMELEKKPGGDDEEEFGNRPDDVDIDKDGIKSDDEEEPDEEPGDDEDVGSADTPDLDDGLAEREGMNLNTGGVSGSILSEGNVVLAAVIGGGAVLAIAGVAIYKKKKTEN